MSRRTAVSNKAKGDNDMANNYMKDNSSQVAEDIKWILFDDRDYDSLTQFES